MSAMIQVRNVPDSVHRALKARAALEGKSLSDLILDELVTMASLPSGAELRQRLKTAKPATMTESSAAIVRRERDAA